MQQGREATGLVFIGSSSHTFESARHWVLALCPSDGILSGVPLGWWPSLHNLRNFRVRSITAMDMEAKGR